MSNESGLSVSKPVAVWNKYKSINADFKELFKSIGKAAINTALGKWDNVATDVVDASAALGLAETPEEVAWLLIYRSLIQAMVSLVEGNKELLVKPPNMDELDTICNHRLDLSLENMELRIDQDFFRRPKSLPIVEAIKTPFAQWLEDFGVVAAQAQTISHRLPTYFVFALHEEWAKHPDKYACLKKELDTPFTQANEREQAWQRYSAWLQKQVEEPMFLEAFGLKQVYVPLRAYYQREIEGQKQEEFERRLREHKQYEKVVVNLETELEAWLKKGDRNDAIRVISGGPGSGKSSFAKIFAAQVAEKGTIKVLFLPLHQLNPSDDLVDSVGDFINSDIYGILAPNPLLAENAEQQLLIIFDGLDELAMQGKVASEVAQQFVREVQKKVDRFNLRETRLQVLISGRDLVVQANSSEFRQPRQILHILPYFITDDEKERENYIDNQNLLAPDQRQLWWQYYGKAKGYDYTGLPPELDKGNLIEITAQPLLNYLVALSFVQNEVTFSEDTNLNTIYTNLLTAVYQRGWTGYQHPSLQGIQEKDFVRILEEIALASWHGDGRTTTVRDIESHCDNSGLKRLLEIFQEGAKLGVTRLLTAFYFRQSGFNDGVKTFEFTHKSFGEYLTARRIVREVRLIHNKSQDSQNNLDARWGEPEALEQWAILCGASAMDEYLFNFVVDEIGLQNPSEVGEWQKTLCKLISFMLRYGMPMEKLTSITSFHEKNRQARNAEEALLAVLNACARFTKILSKIEWHSPEAFGVWLSRLHGQRVDVNVFCLNCLSFLDLENCILINKDFYRAHLEQAHLEQAHLEGANLVRANLIRANLIRADLVRADLVRAHLVRAHLEGAHLEGAHLEWANLERANLVGANLERANLVGANLVGANLGGANLGGTNLGGANLERANLERANLEGANLERANLRGTILESKDLTTLNQDSNSDFNDAEIH